MPRKKNKQKKLHVKKGDLIEVISGNDRGKRGKVLRVFPDRDRVLIEGINMRTKHQKPTQENPQGGRMKQEMPVHISNVLPVDSVSDQATRVGRSWVAESGKGRWVRVAKVSGETLDK
ncbi:MAG: 50S ribosomal protein L24 [Balneolaceae bacterium]|nr:MAG: 50S ribosomal protein L24 [Balneolaceae bacterium]